MSPDWITIDSSKGNGHYVLIDHNAVIREFKDGFAISIGGSPSACKDSLEEAKDYVETNFGSVESYSY